MSDRWITRHMSAAVHRPATLDDAPRLFEVRRRSILELAPSGMPVEDAEVWAKKLTPAGMAQKLRELEIWVAERDDVIAGWGAIRGDVLEQLYTAPEATVSRSTSAKSKTASN